MSRSSADDRRLDVLRAIVTQYVATREPVGSKAIAQSHDLGVSSATIRNDMAVLEDAGLIYQPHTSAGRVPTDRGYRVFVDRLATLKPMTAPERRAVESFLSDSADIDDVVERTVRLLAQFTRQVALVQYPATSVRTLRHLEVVDLAPSRLVVERSLSLAAPVSGDDVASARLLLRAHMGAATSRDVDAGRDEAVAAAPPEIGPLVGVLADVVAELLAPEESARIVISGVSNLARGAVDFHDITPVLDALEEQMVLMRLFAQAESDGGVHVTIGAENPHEALSEASVVTGTYRAGETAGEGVAHLGVVGPTRMDYARTMSSVRAVAAYLSRFLAT